MNMLIADDELLIRNGLLSLDWKSIGIEEVYSAGNGEEARDLLLSAPVDIVIFDIRMPGMTGLELAAMIKQYSIDTAVILLTGFSEFEYARQAIQSSVYEYLLKPFHPREILETVEKVKKQLEQKRYQARILREHEEMLGKTDVLSQVRNHFPKLSGLMEEIISDMAEQFAEPISQRDFAEKYHFSSNYISKKVKQETGYSFIDILIAIRLTNAVQFLTDGDKVNEACLKAGFNDQRYFSQVFKRVFACSPSDFKKQEHVESQLRFHYILEQLSRKQAE